MMRLFGGVIPTTLLLTASCERLFLACRTAFFALCSGNDVNNDRLAVFATGGTGTVWELFRAACTAGNAYRRETVVAPAFSCL